MSEAIIGVIIGGIIASIFPLFSLIYSVIKDRREQRINRLKEKRTYLEQLYKTAYNQLLEDVKKDTYNIDKLTDYDFLFPKKVSIELRSLISEKDKSASKIKYHLYEVSGAMKHSLSEIDDQIDKEIGIKKFPEPKVLPR